MVVLKAQGLDLFEVAQFGRERTAQIVAPQVQRDDPSVVISGHARPRANRLVTQPVTVGIPTVAIGGIVDCD